jgi:predicted anti-sigma-YlaC factor YlaD
MSLWVTVVVASLLSFAIKLTGYVVPESLMAGERTQRVTTLLPVALLAALVVVQSVTGDAGALVVDARLVAVGVAVVLLLLRELPRRRARGSRRGRRAASPRLGLTAATPRLPGSPDAQATGPAVPHAKSSAAR